MNRLIVGVAIAIATAVSAPAQTVQVEPGVPSYQKASGVSGSLSSTGSDTMNNLMTLWGEAFAKMYPNVKIQVEGKGSSTAPPALISGTAQFGPMSRAMRATGKYPLARFLYVLKDGYYPLPASVVKEELAKIQ